MDSGPRPDDLRRGLLSESVDSGDEPSYYDVETPTGHVEGIEVCFANGLSELR